MKVDIKCFALLLALSVLASCYSPPAPSKMAHVKVETASHPVLFSESSVQLYPAEQDSIRSFMETIPTDTVSYAGLAADDTNPRAVARARSVRDYLVKMGFKPDSIRLQPTAGIDARTVMLSVRYAKAVPPGPCPDWSKNSSRFYQDADASDFGCAYYNDLVVQLADPADFNAGHGAATYDGTRDSVITGRYLSGSSASSTGGSSGSSAGSSGSAGGSTTTTTSSP